MSGRKNTTEGRHAFSEPFRHFETLPAETVSLLATVAGDVTLVLDDTGRILDVTADTQAFPDCGSWAGQDWIDIVTVESRPKVMEMLAVARRGGSPSWRQVNHLTARGDAPVRYALVPTGQGGSFAFGRTMREAAALQQRLLQAQQSLERDYLRMRHIESRYRMLFDRSEEPIIIVEADSNRVREANPAAHAVLGVAPGGLPGGKIASFFPRSARDTLIAFLGAVLARTDVSAIEVAPVDGGEPLRLSASAFRQQGTQFLLLRLSGAAAPAPGRDSAALDVLDAMPDAFVMTDAGLHIETANGAFIELVGAASLEQIKGAALGDFVGRPGIDMELIDGQLAKHQVARNVSTVIRPRDAGEGEPVEISAVRIDGERPCSGFMIRPIGRRLRDLPRADNAPRSVEQLTELVGRMALRDIVRESTDLIERLCIEAALDYTANNRASAAEILGLSRQSLYSKLYRHGLGNVVEHD